MKCTDQQIIIAATTHPTMLSAAKSVGLNITSFASRAKRLGVYKTNQFRKGITRPFKENKTRRIPLSEILAGLHPQYQTNHLKRRLFKEGIKSQLCEECGIEGETVSLSLEHVNGTNNDHRLENLKILCPNCHSRTTTFGGRNKRATGTSISDKQIIDLILKGLNTRSILRQVNLTPYGVNYRRVDRLRKIVEYVKSKQCPCSSIG